MHIQALALAFQEQEMGQEIPRELWALRCRRDRVTLRRVLVGEKGLSCTLDLSPLVVELEKANTSLLM